MNSEMESEMEWELSKENVQPLRKGRNVEKLNASLRARVDGTTKSLISDEHRKMVEAIDDYVGDDPLKPWTECIKWVKEYYPSGGSQSKLLPLIELCLRTFCKDPLYADDIRYLNVWMEYADRVTNPREIYSFMEDNNIGQQHAIFYENHARYWELQQKLSNAKSIYELGIARKAEPLDSLKASYSRFVQRAMAESMSKDNTQSSPPPAQPLRSFGNQVAGLSRVNTFQHQARRTNAPKIDRSKNTSQQFSVFVDDDDMANFPSSRSGGSTFVTETEKNKENVQRASKWTSVRVPQSKPSIPQIPGDFQLEVFRDDDAIGDDQTPVRNKVPASRALRLDDAAAEREEDKLKQNPLIYFEDDIFDLL